MCANDDCIPTSKVCNGVPDCEDNSDEMQVCKGKLNQDIQGNIYYFFQHTIIYKHNNNSLKK